MRRSDRLAVNGTFDLDHVALAVRDAVVPMQTLVGRWGGTLLSGGDAAGFRAMQIRLGDLTVGMTVELLEPCNVDRSDFLVRFLDRHGDAPHHLTFKVPDLAAELERLRTRGLEPIGVDLTHPDWKEAFLHPRDSHGTVIQLAESTTWTIQRAWEPARSGRPAGNRWWPEPPSRAAQGVLLQRVVMSSNDREETAGFFLEVLGGQLVATRSDRVELQWPGGGTIAVEDGSRAGIDRLEVSGMESNPVEIAGTKFVGSN